MEKFTALMNKKIKKNRKMFMIKGIKISANSKEDMRKLSLLINYDLLDYHLENEKHEKFRAVINHFNIQLGKKTPYYIHTHFQSGDCFYTDKLDVFDIISDVFSGFNLVNIDETEESIDLYYDYRRDFELISEILDSQKSFLINKATEKDLTIEFKEDYVLINNQKYTDYDTALCVVLESNDIDIKLELQEIENGYREWEQRMKPKLVFPKDKKDS